VSQVTVGQGLKLPWISLLSISRMRLKRQYVAPILKPSKACTASKCAKCMQGGQLRQRKRCTTEGCKCPCPRYIDMARATTSSKPPAIPATTQAPPLSAAIPVSARAEPSSTAAAPSAPFRVTRSRRARLSTSLPDAT